MRLFLPFFGLLFFQTSFSQDYGDYYKRCYEADSLIDLKQYALGLEKYKSAFSTVDYVHYRYLRSAAKCAIRTKDFQSAHHYLRQSIINTGYVDFFSVYKRVPSSKFKRTAYYKNLKDSLSVYLDEYHTRINWEYRSIIDSLHYVDQYIIRGSKRVKGDYDIDESTLPENRYVLDDNNFQTLLECIDKWGFPSEEKVGGNAIMLLTHNMRLAKNEEYHPIAFKAVWEGHYNPRYFSWMYEQYYNQNKDSTYFYLGSDLSNENRMRVIENRARFYLRPLSHAGIKRVNP
ncbi:hypothetical protein JYT21_00445 [bacterium AH-315-B15]|nr:hypothetical protein [bacterium AH-315-B15]